MKVSIAPHRYRADAWFDLVDEHGEPCGVLSYRDLVGELTNEWADPDGVLERAPLLLERLRGRIRTRDWMRLSDWLYNREDPNHATGPRPRTPCRVCGAHPDANASWFGACGDLAPEDLCYGCALWAAEAAEGLDDVAEMLREHEAAWAQDRGSDMGPLSPARGLAGT